jgi:multidrug efflux system outer membrane protein
MNKKIYKVVLPVLVALVMQSCFTAKTYERPNVKTDNLYRMDKASTDTISLGDVSWNDLFTDPILQEHINKGLQNNLDIRIAVQNIAASEAYMKQGKAGYFPSIGIGTDWTHQELSRNSQFGTIVPNTTTDQYQVTGNLSWEADIWGKIRSNKRATSASYLQTLAAKQAVQTELIANIARTYFQLMTLDAQLQIVDSTLINRFESIEVIKALKESGSVTEVGVRQTEAQMYATQLIKEDLQNSIVILENAFNIVLGESPKKVNRSTFDNQNITADVTVGIPAFLLRKRPDVIAAEYNLISNFEMTNVARSEFYPSLKITATGGLQSIDIQKLFSANSLFVNLVAGLTQPLFNKRQIKTRFEVAKASQEKAYLEFQKTLLVAGREVSDALQNYSNETTKLQIRKKQVQALKSAAGFSDELLKYGLVNYLEVLTAKDQALNTELKLIDNHYNQYDSIISLYRALGGGN